MADLNTVSGNNNKFIVRILQVNGGTDENVHNNEGKATFASTPVWNGGNFAVSFKTSGAAPFGPVKIQQPGR